MRIILNKDEELVKEIQSRLKENGGYCPCALEKNSSTKCICEDFRKKISEGYLGECNCGLYNSIPSIIYLCGDTYYKQDFLNWCDHFSKKGYLVFMPALFVLDQTKDEEKQNLSNIHIQKMTFADTIFIIDKFGKIDDLTEKVIEQAKKLGKKVLYASEIDN